MINLLLQGQVEVFIMIMIAVVISLSFHEFGHAWMANYFGDNTAKRMGRLTINPIAHIDPFGLLMIAFIGFGYGKPVPTDPRNFNSRKAFLWVNTAGPFINLVVAFVAINIQVLGAKGHIEMFSTPGPQVFFSYLAFINLIIMLFTLLPLGPLKGSQILCYFLPNNYAHRYATWNEKYGTMALFGLIILSIIGLPIFSSLMQFAQSISRFLIIF